MVSKGGASLQRNLCIFREICFFAFRSIHPGEPPSGRHQTTSEADSVTQGGRDDGYEPSPELCDFDNLLLKEDIDASFERKVGPPVLDVCMDRSKDKMGYEINFNRHFYKYTPPCPLEEIHADLKRAEEEILRLLCEVTS